MSTSTQDMFPMTTAIRLHVESAETRAFFKDGGEEEETAITHLSLRIIQMFSDPSLNEARRREAIDHILTHLMNEATTKWAIYERTIDRIMEDLYYQGFLPPLLVLNANLATCDFSLKNHFSSTKLCKMRSTIPHLTYKGVRSFFKKLYEKMASVPTEITSAQLEMLRPMEDLLIYIMKRESNVIPALFVASELNNITKQKKLMFSRVIETVTQMENSFRSLAELSYVTNRSYLFPIPAHPSYITTAMLWKLDPAGIIMTHRLHLPFRVEMYTAQSYALLMVLKQWKSRESFLMMIKQTVGASGGTKSQLDNIVHILIGEAMLFMERFPLQSEAVAMVWDNITVVLSTLLHAGWCEMSRFLVVLSQAVQKSGCRRAKDELMWTILQNMKQLDRRNETLFKNATTAIADLYSYLYGGGESPVVMSTDCPLTMVRSLAAACIWIDLSSAAAAGGEEDDALPPPSPFLLGQIEFITKRNPTETPTEAILAVIINAYVNTNLIEAKQAIESLVSRLSCEQTFFLGGLKTVSLFVPFEYDLLSALGSKGQVLMLHHLLGEMKNIFTTDLHSALPSPALIETVARLANQPDNEKSLSSSFARFVEESKDQVKDCRLLFILIELMTYRCFNQPHSSRANVVTGAFQALMNAVAKQDNKRSPTALSEVIATNYDLYSAIELLILRLCTWLPPADSISMINRMVLNTLGRDNNEHALLPTIRYAYHPFDYPSDLTRALYVSYLRASRLVGQEVRNELFKKINGSYVWTPSQTEYLNDPSRQEDPQDMQSVNDDHTFQHKSNSERPHKLEPNPANLEEEERKKYVEFKQFADSDIRVLAGITDENIPQFVSHSASLDQPQTILCSLFSVIKSGAITPPNRENMKLALSKLSVSAQLTAINSFFDYFIHTHQFGEKAGEIGELQRNAATLATMSITDEIIPLERIFFCAAFSARSDMGMKVVLNVIRALVREQSFMEMATQLTHLPKLGANDFIKKMNELKTRRRASSHSQQQHRVYDVNASYYGHPLLKILSSVDTLLERALQLNIPDDHFMELLDAFSPLYRFHPYPLTYCLSVLSPLYGQTCPHDASIEMIKQRPRTRYMVLSIVKFDNSQQSPFTPLFVSVNPSTDDPFLLVCTLTNNLISTFCIGTVADDSLDPSPRCPTSFYTDGEWRSSELSPQGHALYSIAVECLASRLPNDVIVNAFIDMLWQERLDKPLLYINAVSLILTTLPSKFTECMFEEIISIFGEPLEDYTIDQIILETFERASLNLRATKVTAIIALSQAFWHHATVPTLIHFVKRFKENLEGVVKTEKDLFLAFHIVIPLLQRIADAKEKSHVDRCFRMVVLFYKLLTKIPHIEREDTICDLLYHFKYMFVGDFVKEEINGFINEMPPSLQDKLKFIVYQSDGRGTHEDHEMAERKDSILKSSIVTN